MITASMTDELSTTDNLVLDHRHDATDSLLLVQLDPSTLVDGIAVANGYLAHEFSATGQMRETCPVCKTVHLKLVLRQNHVRKAHMFCEQCTRCFDALFQDGSPAFG